MLRTFKYFAISTAGVPAPLVGTTLAAAILAGNEIVAQVADSSMFLNGDWAQLMEANGTLVERVFIDKIVDATHVRIKTVLNNHAAGAFVILGGACTSIGIQTKDGNLGDLFVGLGPAFASATGTGMVWKLAKVAAAAAPTDKTFEAGGSVNGIDISQFWVDGTNTDKYLVVMNQI